jgi:hypothetical protein
MKKRNQLPTLEYLNECFSYDCETGVLTWKERPISHFAKPCLWITWNKKWANTVAGGTDSKGHRLVKLSGLVFSAHRICWKLYHGTDPVNFIDHIDHNGLNNRIENLRDVTHLENSRNQKHRKSNRSGVMGVFWIKKLKKWQAKIKHGLSDVNLGFYENFADAVAARKAAEKKYGYHPNHGVGFKEMEAA